MKVYIVRHGETDWNKERKLQGQVDIPLNAFGRHLAEETGKGLKDVPFDFAVSSPLGRAVETARLILGGRDVKIYTDDRIKEMAFGIWEGGCCSEDGWNLPEGFRLFFSDPEHYQAPEGGETFWQVKERIGSFLDELFGTEEYRGKNILVVTHGAALCGMINCIKQKPVSEYWGDGVHKNCAVTEVEADDLDIHIISENKVYYKDEVKEW